MTERTRVVFVVPSLGLGGAERQVVQLVNELDPTKFDVTMFVFGKPFDLVDHVDRSRVRLVLAPRISRLDVRPVLRLARLMRRHRFHVVHCTLQISLAVGYASARLSGTRPAIVDALHSTVPRSARYALADRFFYRHLMARCEALITVSENQKAFWTAQRPPLGTRMRTVYNGIDLATFHDGVDEDGRDAVRRELSLSADDFVIGMVAALRPEKNHLGVLEAAARIVKRRPEAKFVFVGGAVAGFEAVGPELRARVAELGLEAHVRWVGKTLTPARYAAVFDVAILFSTTESLPLALIEALSMGKPVVSSAVGGIPEIVVSGETGFLVPTGDVAAFVAAIERLIDDPALRTRMSAAARELVEARFSSAAMTRGTENILLAARNGQPC